MFRKNSVVIFLILLIASVMYSQQKDFRVEYYRMEGKLTKQDLKKNNFGRYDGYQMPMQKGERAYFIIYSDQFHPNLILVDPNNNMFKQLSSNGEDFVATGFTVPKSGEWVLYVLGDSTALGNYNVQYGFADSASLFLSNNADFSTGISYLLAHADAYFVFPQTIPSKKPLYKISGANDAFINGDDASYNASFYSGDDKKKASNIFNDVVAKIKKCINKSWKVKSKDWKTNSTGIEKSIEWIENKKNYQRVIKVSFVDLSNEQSTDYPNKYLIDLTIFKY